MNTSQTSWAYTQQQQQNTAPEWLEFVDKSTFASVAVAEVINAIIDRGGDALYDLYLREKEADYVIERTMQSLKLISDLHVPITDGAEYCSSSLSSSSSSSSSSPHRGSLSLWTCEAEPQPAPLDSWARASIPTRVPFTKRLRGAANGGPDHDHQKALREAALLAQRQTAQERAQSRGAALAQLQMAAAEKERVTIFAENGDSNDHAESNNESMTPEQIAMMEERTRIAREFQNKKLSAAQHAARFAEEEAARAERDKVFAKKLRGKNYTVDERGGILLVDKPNPERLPSVVLPVKSKLVAGNNADEQGDEEEEYILSESPSRSPTSRSNTGKGGVGAMTGRDRVSIKAMAKAKSNPDFFRNSISAQPSLIDAHPDLNPGIEIRENGRVLRGPDAASDSMHMTKTELGHLKQEASLQLQASIREHDFNRGGGGSFILSGGDSHSSLPGGGVGLDLHQGSSLLGASTMDSMTGWENTTWGGGGGGGEGQYSSNIQLQQYLAQGPLPRSRPQPSTAGTGAPPLPTSTAQLLGNMYSSLSDVQRNGPVLLQQARPVALIRANQAYDGDVPRSAQTIQSAVDSASSAMLAESIKMSTYRPGSAHRSAEGALSYSSKAGNRLITRAGLDSPAPSKPQPANKRGDFIRADATSIAAESGANLKRPARR